MLIKVVAILLLSLSAVITNTAASPIALSSATALTKYDQRQDGELNVNVGLDNFVILVARPVSSLDLFGAMAGLLTATDTRHSDIQALADSATNSQGTVAEKHHQQQQQQPQQQVTLDNEQKESSQQLQEDQEKEEPRNYAQQLQRGKDMNSEKSESMDDQKKSELQHHVQPLLQDQLSSKSSQVAEEKTIAQGSRGLEEVVRTLRDMKEKELRDKEKSPAAAANAEKSTAIDGIEQKFVESVEEPQTLRLVGDSVENCGPGRSRDSKGICQRNDRSEEHEN